jgi:hypothetical protein
LTATGTETRYDRVDGRLPRSLAFGPHQTLEGEPSARSGGVHHLRTDGLEAEKLASARTANDLVLADVRDAEADAVEPIRISQQQQE